MFGNKESTIDLVIDPKYLEYIDYLDRDGLIYPSNLLFKILQVSYNIFNVCVGEDIEDSFLKLGNPKIPKLILYTMYLFVTSDDNYIGIYYVCEQCDIPCFTPMVKAIGCFCNICLNNNY